MAVLCLHLPEPMSVACHLELRINESASEGGVAGMSNRRTAERSPETHHPSSEYVEREKRGQSKRFKPVAISNLVRLHEGMSQSSLCQVGSTRWVGTDDKVSGLSFMRMHDFPYQSNPYQSNPDQSNPDQSNPDQSDPGEGQKISRLVGKCGKPFEFMPR